MLVYTCWKMCVQLTSSNQNGNLRSLNASVFCLQGSSFSTNLCTSYSLHDNVILLNAAAAATATAVSRAITYYRDDVNYQRAYWCFCSLYLEHVL